MDKGVDLYMKESLERYGCFYADDVMKIIFVLYLGLKTRLEEVRMSEVQ